MMTAIEKSKLRIGTRGSPLALAQTHQVRDLLIAANPDLGEPGAVTIEVIKTTGDAILDRPLSELGGKGLFTREIDDAMLAGTIDIAVHSMKDVPTYLPDGIVLPCMLEREDVRDAFLGRDHARLADLPEGSVVGTASLRRGAQILAMRPDIKVISFRGNVQTRLDKLARGEADATMLAIAGLNRLGMADKASSVLEIDEMLPAVAQGAVGVTCRAGDETAHRWLAPLNHRATQLCVEIERAFLTRLDGSCRTPIGGLARLKRVEDPSGTVFFRGMIIRTDGKVIHQTTREGLAADGIALGDDAGAELLAKAGPGFFQVGAL
ncbi:hydroxymethylbilane synthase [Rhodospirillum rubrum]|uniref:Porphobilinogen deaminase n=1 Tax=Rhodospirillum rubrum (strain ATCC 11170 / ATH 1.1.1 / DSM 467 / LMG 4362 / NCIMB 8255 / S1) TaxID=269796 RepID=Q2RND3_RHORT|nr:hydroxymethylbilane synthase [Rhodospirillum rubrum]ABC24362.1 Porphobilinogen deaminase [Rhodospirillum rubrum ATCC 11170]AEO50113.1 porphobilinogen deaminase [Rhodospirillum rubrum F11]MBK5956084.1 hydroxymethylbilane synthase [Rhodospirillum rubrum]QXG80287.1 hydroxymethylbilane synthase [Rhodospirillum rubrum]HCF18590.1 hydroxymethylbilane synthase [Rhodospirillum rubrum]